MTTPVIAQDAPEPTQLPVIPYYSSSQNFNVPIPPGWRQISTEAGLAEFIHPDVDGAIYALAVQAEDVQSALNAAFEQLIPELEIEQRLTGVITLDGLDWYKSLYDIVGGGNITAFVQQRDSTYYVLLYLNRNPEIDLYMLAIEAENNNEQVSIEEVLSQLYPGVDLEPITSNEVELSNGTWIRSTYQLPDGEALHTLHQVRFDTTYVVIERGDGETLDTVNKALFTALFGFFVTPDNDEYLLLGIVVAAGLVIGLILSMVVRYRNLQKDERLIQQLKQDVH